VGFIRCAGILFALALVACTTPLGKANKLLEAGLHQEAIEAYENILKSEPDNADAKIGLGKARSELWRKELISIRLLRMSGDAKGALERLESLLERMKIWDVSNFQSGELVSAEEEVRNGRRLLTSLIQQKINERKPVVATYLWNEFDAIREAKQFGAFSVELLEDIRKAGLNLCITLKPWTSSTSFSFNTVAKSVCASYGGASPAVPLDNQKDFRFSKLLLAGKIEFRNFDGNSQTQVELLRDFIESKMQSAGLYASDSPHTLTLALSGDYTRDYETHSTIRTHSYTVKVPYQDFEKYEEKEFVKVTRNGREESVERPVQKQRPVTRFREEPRTHSYPAVQHREKLRWNAALIAKTKEETSLSFAQEKENAFVTHNQNLPHMGLKPAEAKFIDVTQWLSENYKKFAEQYVGKLTLQIADRYCQAAKGQEMTHEAAENFSRCAELNEKNVAASAWFSNTFGVTRAELLKILAHASLGMVQPVQDPKLSSN
jgi:hypothetical protein